MTSGSTRFAVVDTETSGLEECDRVVEVAAAFGEWRSRTRSLALLSTFTTLVRPGVPVTPGARAAHHISDAELARAKTMEILVAKGKLPDLSGHVVVAHNAPFDLQMLRQSGAEYWTEGCPVLDTCHLAKHLFPEAPRYGNQVLRYYLELAVPGPLGGPPHRALPDALVTFALLERELQEAGSPSRLIELMSLLPLLRTCHVGKFRGRPWSEVDVGMLRWIMQRDFDAEVKHTAQHWINVKSGRLIA